MIIYVSDSSNSKKNGGSSLSGFEFLQLLRIHYEQVVFITSDSFGSDFNGTSFYGSKLNPIHTVKVVRRKIGFLDCSLRSFLRPFYYFLKDFRKMSNIDLDEFYTEGGLNILYINSWSAIYTLDSLKNSNNFLKVCVVRGSVESFIHQSFEVNKERVIQDAANYLEGFNKLIFVSSNGLQDWSNILKKRIESFYLPNSINEIEVNRVSLIRPEVASDMVGFMKDDFNVVIVGSVQKRKAQNILLDVIKEFLEIKPNLKFHIVGVISKTWGGDSIFNDIKKSKYSQKFIFYGHSDEALLYMQAADLLIFTSYAEAFPRTVAEYMSLGKLILASNVSGVNEMIKDGVNGYLFDPTNSLSLVEAFRRSQNDEQENIKLAENAFSTYWNCFSKKCHVSRALEVFRSIDSNY